MSFRLTALPLMLSLALSWAGPRAAMATDAAQPATVAGKTALPTVADSAVDSPAAASEPPPAVLEEPEPAPAPLSLEKTAAQLAMEATTEAAAQAEAESQNRKRARALRTLTETGWLGVALTLGLVVAGTTLGILAQTRSDALSRLSRQSIDGFPPTYDASQHTEWLRLQDEGPLLNRASIGCLLSAGGLAVGTGVIFWQRERRFGKDLSAVGPPVSLNAGNGGPVLWGRF